MTLAGRIGVALGVGLCVVAGLGLGLRTGASAQSKARVTGVSAIEAGRYLVRLGGCNDCHTDGYAESGGKTPPETDWLQGSAVGFRGPWGVSYPPNLRLYFQRLSEDEWVRKARAVVGRPPMPYPALHAMSDADLRALYRYIRSLGPKGPEAPAAAPPGETPKTPYILFVPQQGG